jgi:transposase-like protein
MQDVENTAITTDMTAATEQGAKMFRTGVLSAPVSIFFDEEACREWVLKRLHQDGPRCPGCGDAVPEKFLPRFYEAERLKCGVCGKFFTGLTGTFLSGCQLTFAEVVALAILLSPELTDKKIADVLGMSSANIRIWRLKFDAMDKLFNG